MSTPVRIGRRSSLRRPARPGAARPRMRGVRRVRLLRRSMRASVVLGRLQPQRRREPSGGDHRLVARNGHGDGPGSNLRTISPTTWEPRDTGFSTSAGTCTRLVISRSEPINSKPSAVAEIRRSWKTGSAPLRLATVRCASRRHPQGCHARTGTSHWPPRCFRIRILALSSSRACGLWTTRVVAGGLGNASHRFVHRCAQRGQGRPAKRRVLPGVDAIPAILHSVYPLAPCLIR